MDVVHPQGLREGWWEERLASIVVDMSKNAAAMKAQAVNSTHVDLLERARLATLNCQLYAQLAAYLNRCIAQATDAYATAIMALEDETLPTLKLAKLGHMARCQTDLDHLLRLAVISTEGVTRRLYAEMRSQLIHRKEKLTELHDLPELDDGLQGWLKISGRVRELIRQYGPQGETAFNPELYGVLQSLTDFTYVPPAIEAQNQSKF